MKECGRFVGCVCAIGHMRTMKELHLNEINCWAFALLWSTARRRRPAAWATVCALRVHLLAGFAVRCASVETIVHYV